MQPKTLAICHKFINDGCRKVCPLAKSCQTNMYENHAALATRMNEKSARVTLKGWP